MSLCNNSIIYCGKREGERDREGGLQKVGPLPITTWSPVSQRNLGVMKCLQSSILATVLSVIARLLVYKPKSPKVLYH